MLTILIISDVYVYVCVNIYQFTCKKHILIYIFNSEEYHIYTTKKQGFRDDYRQYMQQFKQDICLIHSLPRNLLVTILLFPR